MVLLLSHTQLVNCSRHLHPTRPQRKHNQHAFQSTVLDAAVLKKKLQIESTLAYQYTALSFFINKVDYNEALICNVISCYKTRSILLRITMISKTESRSLPSPSPASLLQQVQALTALQHRALALCKMSVNFKQTRVWNSLMTHLIELRLPGLVLLLLV